MNKIIFKLWIDARRANLKREQNLAIQSNDYIRGQIDLLDTIEDDFNLEEVTEDLDYHIEKNF
jgi:hypothetical protein